MSDKMVLIGNGYDIYRSKKTSYNDFKEWVEDTIKDDKMFMYNFLKSLKDKADLSDIINKRKNNKNIVSSSSYNIFFKLDLSSFNDNEEYFSTLYNLVLNGELDFLLDEYKKNDKISVLLFFYILISKEFCTNDEIYWGDVEKLFKKVYINNDVNSGNSYYSEEVVDYFIDNYDIFVDIFVNQFIKEKENIKSANSTTGIEHALEKMSKTNNVNIICLNYIYPVENYHNDNIIMFHGREKEAIFGSTVHKEVRKKGYNKIDKLYKRLNISSRNNRLNLANTNEMFTLGFSFSENDDYIIHSILNDNEEICINIIEFPDGKKYVQEQIDSLYSCITRFDKGFELIEKMIIRDQIKIISHTEFIDISKKMENTLFT